MMQLYFEKQGSGEALIMLHGLFGSFENLGAIARILAEHYTLYRVDLRNHGNSFHSDTMSFPEMANDVIRLMDHLGLTRAHFFGHSLGGKVAMSLALAHPERVVKLVIADIAPKQYPPHHDEILEALQTTDPSKLISRKEADEQLQRLIPDLSVRQFILKNMVRGEDGSFSWRINVDAMVASYDELRKAVGDEDGQAVSFSGQTLFLRGELSNYITERDYAEIVRKFPQAKIETIAGASHWLHGEKPTEVAAQIIAFLP